MLDEIVLEEGAEDASFGYKGCCASARRCVTRW